MQSRLQGTFLQCFDQQCIDNPDAIALCQDAEVLSYAQLSKLGDKAVAALRAQGVKAGASVGICSERSVAIVAIMIGCYRTGALFVPLDPAFPESRLLYMLEDSSIECVVVDTIQPSSELAWVETDAIRRIEMSSISDFTPCPPTQRCAPSPTDGAYVMYTSGSTGQPKGVVVSHGALACYCHADIDVYQLCKDDRTLQFATLSFDISIEEIFPSLMIGAAVILRPVERSAAQIELSDVIEQHRISAVHLATGYWHEWVDLMLAANSCVPNCLRLMVVTGDKVSVGHYERWKTLAAPTVLWANAYGPTETTVSATVFIPPTDWNEPSLPIGVALPGYTTYILDANGRPVTDAEVGELYIGGGALADGYQNKPLLTEKAFVPDPFVVPNANLDSELAPQDLPDGQITQRVPEVIKHRMYRTGDLAHWRDDGNIVCVGRIDHQIKVGSYRVEPGEIESVLIAHPGVDEVLVTGENHDGTVLLTAYLAAGDSDILTGKLAASVAQQLPEVMRPARYAVMKSLPKTINGKVDRAALSQVKAESLLSSESYLPPTTEMQSKLCAIWAEVLKLPRVGLHDCFTSLGGNSLMAVRVIARMHSELDIVISTRDFFFLDSVYSLAAHLEGKAVERQVPPPQPLFINTRSRQLYTLLQKPERHNDNGRGLLIVPPLGNEQRRVQRPFRSFMQNLSRMGFTVLRFDWQGTGNSSSDSCLLHSEEHWADDLRDAALLLSGHVQSLDLLAIRMGALIAAKTDLVSLPINNRFFLEPVFDGGRWLDEMEQLHTEIRADTFCFLKPRTARKDGLSEYAGLVLNQSMKNSISSLNLPRLLQSVESNSATHIIRSRMDVLSDLSMLGSKLHEVEDSNDWINPRTLTHDMRINDAAVLVTDIMLAQQARQQQRRAGS